MQNNKFTSCSIFFKFGCPFSEYFWLYACMFEICTMLCIYLVYLFIYYFFLLQCGFAITSSWSWIMQYKISLRQMVSYNLVQTKPSLLSSWSLEENTVCEGKEQQTYPSHARHQEMHIEGASVGACRRSEHLVPTTTCVSFRSLQENSRFKRKEQQTYILKRQTTIGDVLLIEGLWVKTDEEVHWTKQNGGVPDPTATVVFLWEFSRWVNSLIYTTQKKLRVKGNLLITFVSMSSLVWTSFFGGTWLFFNRVIN